MKATCIDHPSNEPLIIVRKWQIEACDGNACAAALLSFFEYWHNIKLEQSKKAAEANDLAQFNHQPRNQDESCWQWHTEAQLQEGILVYRKNSIADALKLLEQKEFLEVARNQNPRMLFDRTRYFRFHPEIVNAWLKSRAPSSEIGAPSPEIGPAIMKAETTSETTSEISCQSSTDRNFELNSEPPTRVRKKKPQSIADTRHKRFMELIHKAHVHFVKVPPMMGAATGKNLKQLLKDAPHIDEKRFRNMLSNYHKSEDHNPADAPAYYVSKLPKYELGPLNKFGRTLEVEQVKGTGFAAR